METKWKQQLRERMEHDGKRWIAVVTNRERGKNGDFIILKSNFFSEDKGFERLLHKVELDLMTNLNYGINYPLEIVIKEVGN